MDFDAVKSKLHGPVGLVMAPFQADLSLDVPALKRNIRYILDGGMKTGQGAIICPCGSGEYLTLSTEEHQQMVKAAVETTEGTLPVIAGVASCNIRVAIELAANAKAAGATCVMIPPPYYDRVTDDIIFAWYKGIAEAADVAIVVYDQVWRGPLGTTLSHSLMARLATIPNIVALKYGSPAQYYDYIKALDQFADRFAFIDNSLGFTSTAGHMHGAAGFISGPSSWWPQFELEYWSLLQAGKYKEADLLHAKLGPFMKFHRGDEFESGMHDYYYAPSILKAALEFVGLTGGPVRPPYFALTSQQKEKLWSVLEQIGAPRGRATV